MSALAFVIAAVVSLSFVSSFSAGAIEQPLPVVVPALQENGRPPGIETLPHALFETRRALLRFNCANDDVKMYSSPAAADFNSKYLTGSEHFIVDGRTG